jgi:hypothetical protein
MHHDVHMQYVCMRRIKAESSVADIRITGCGLARKSVACCGHDAVVECSTLRLYAPSL